MLVQLVNISVEPGSRDRFLQAFRINFDGTRKEPGNVRFDLLCDPDDENKFSVYEVFRDMAALEDHRRSRHYRECMEIMEPIIAGKISKTYFAAILI